MKKLLAVLALAVCAAAPLCAQDYPLTADSKVQDGVPKGEILKFTFDKSTVFPGTSRSVSVYVPKQYDPAKPACVYVNQDGIQWNAPVVFDNLIAKNEMPVTIGVFVTPGVVPAANANALPRFNRSLEYDGLGPAYADFLLGELLPFVETQKTADGRAIVLSKNGNDRAIGGSSSGAIAAFTAAWERPDAFSRVFSAIGTYVGLRGGNEYSTLIRKIEPKPLRVFLQGGSNDNNIYGGDWWIANQAMQRSFAFAGYENNFVWGTGGHNGAHGTQLFPDAMRYLWKDWPQPVRAGLGAPQLKEILIVGEEWKQVFQMVMPISRLAVTQGGVVRFFTAENGGIISLNSFDSTSDSFKRDAAFAKLVNDPGDNTNNGPNGEFLVEYEGKIVSFGSPATKTFATGMQQGPFVALQDGSLYVLQREGMTITSSDQNPQIVRIAPNGEKKVVAKNVIANGPMTLSPDQTLLYIVDKFGPWVCSYQIQPDGSLKHGQRFYHLHSPNSGPIYIGGMCVDRDGRLYVATNLGIQVCDQAGRVNSIIPVLSRHANDVVLGGADFDTLFISTFDGKIYKRKVKPKGAPSFLPPVKPAGPRL